MSHASALVSIYHGAADTDEFWDVSLNQQQLAYAEVEDEDRRGFSLCVDLETGAVDLNAGYEPGSKPHGEETRMFNEFRDSAVEALAQHARSRDILPAFLKMASAEEAVRRDRLNRLAEALDEDDDFED